MTYTKDEQAAWDAYFSQQAGWTLHPGSSFYREDGARPTLEECADMATKMVAIRRERMKKDLGEL